MTFDERVDALSFLGLTIRQSQFVVLVALHGGYCLSRQYSTFAGVTQGGTVKRFLDDLVGRKLMTRLEYRRDRGFIYHLRSRRIFEAIGQEYRGRPVSPALMARRLMLLDVVLLHPAAMWLATESDKVAFFTERFKVPPADLPQCTHGSEIPPSGSRSSRPPTTCFFTDKWPIGLDVGAANETRMPPRVTFVALILDSSGRTLTHFLNVHARLLAYLPAWTIMAVCPAGHGGLRACQAVYDRITGRRLAPEVPETELLHYFKVRLAFDTGEGASVSEADWSFYREARLHLLGPAIDAQYAAYRVQARARLWSDRASLPRRVQALAAVDERCLANGALELYRLPYAYQQFGDFAGEC